MSNTVKDSDNQRDKEGGRKDQQLVIEGDAMDRFVRSFEASARRWELIVYPTLLAFIVLAAYGFFLIYQLSKDLNILASGMDPEMGRHLTDISASVAYLSENVRTMTRRVDRMTRSIEDISGTIVEISGKMDSLDNLDPMLVHMGGMNTSMYALTMQSDAMRHELTGMGRNISRPMSIMNSFMPW